MANYIQSNANRFYVAIEQSYGLPAPIAASNRFPAVRLKAHQKLEGGRRQDKTGARTFAGSPTTAKRISAFEMATYLTSWNGLGEPDSGPLVRAAMGADPEFVTNLNVAAANGAQVQTSSPHGLGVGSAISTGEEIRFVSSVIDPSTLILNVPFSTAPVAGADFTASVCYKLTTPLPSLSLYDYWDPSGAVSRIVSGIGVDSLRIEVSGDYHELLFSGPAADVLDSTSATYNLSGLTQFPAEPALSDFDYSIVTGHLGQVWLGSPASEFFTLTRASIEIKNNLLVRDQDFGSAFPQRLVARTRELVTQFTLFAQNTSEAQSLYTAARNRTAISVMLQLGQQQGQMMAVLLPNVIPEMPIYDDVDSSLSWEFNNSIAQGISNDEVYIAFA